MKKNKKIDKNFDYFTVLVQRDRLEEVENRYELFSWEILKEDEHERFGNVVVVEMRRPHKIKDKDRLQFFQVQMEFLLNEEEKCKRDKHKKSTTYGLTFGILCAFIFACGLYLLLKNTSILQIILGSVFTFLGLVLTIVLLVIVLKMAKCEDVLHEENSKHLSSELDSVCKKVSIIKHSDKEAHK